MHLSLNRAKRGRSAQSGAWRTLLALLLLGVSYLSIAQSTLTPEAQRGVAWLQSQIQPDGQLVIPPAPIARPLQMQSEVPLAFKAAAVAIPGSFISALQGGSEADTESVSRRIVAIHSAGGATDAARQQLLGMQNVDGGFGALRDLPSNPLDTAYALMALRTAPSQTADAAVRAIAYLETTRAVPVGNAPAFGVNQQSDVFVAATIVLAVNQWRSQFGTTAVASSGKVWLLAQRNAGNTFGAAHLDATVALAWMSERQRDATLINPLVNALVTSQLANGSWSGDPFVTALAVRALATHSDPQTQPSASINGAVVDNQTSTALSGVRVELLKQTTITEATTDASGAFALTSLDTGDYQIRFSLAGYVTRQVSVTIADKQQLMLPTVRLSPRVATGSLRGSIVDAASGMPIEAASVSLASDRTRSLVTGSTGAFALSDIPVGDNAIQISYSGFVSRQVTVSITAGQITDIGAVAIQRISTTATLSGTVRDANGAPLPNATLSAASRTVLTGSDGAYRIDSIEPGSTAIVVSLSGYQSVTTQVDMVAGVSYDLSPTLYAATQPSPPPSISGVIVDSGTQAPIAGASVTVNGNTQTTDANGQFSIVNLVAGRATIQVSAATYRSRNGEVLLVAGRNDIGRVTLERSTPAPAVQTIQSTGPLSRVFVAEDLSAQVAHASDSSYATFRQTAVPGDFGTFLAVGGVLYAPQFDPSRSAIATLNPFTPFTRVSQSTVQGLGTISDPFKVTTVVNVGATGISITQTDTYTIGQETFRTDIVVSNLTDQPSSAVLYRAFDCYLGGNDYGYGLLSPTEHGTAVGCARTVNNSPPDRVQQLIPLTAGSSYLETDYASMWAALSARNMLSNSCQCGAYLDNAVALSWNVSIPARGSVSYSLLNNFSSLGVQPVVVTKTADSGVSSPAEYNGYRISISNPRPDPITLTSIVDELPAGFTYQAGSATGLTTSDPSISGNTLTWNGPFTISAGGTASLHFRVQAPVSAGNYLSQASVNLSPTETYASGPGAAIEVRAVKLTVLSDKAAYQAFETASITATVTNANNAAVTGTLSVVITDANGVVVARVVDSQSAGIPPLGALNRTASYALGALLVGRYQVTASLISNGVEIARSVAVFDVQASATQPGSMTSVATDRARYAPTDRVEISSRVTNPSANLVLTNIALRVEVLDFNGVQHFQVNHAINQLLPGDTRDFAATQTLSNLPAGTYTVNQVLLNAAAQVLESKQVTYLVQSTADTGFGLTGTIIGITPQEVQVGQVVTIESIVRNDGNADLVDASIKIIIVDPQLGTALVELPASSPTISSGATVRLPDNNWQVTGRSNATLLAVLMATTGVGPSANSRALATQSFQVLPSAAAGSIAASAGTPQSATVLQNYPVALEVTVRDGSGQPLANATVTFTAPSNGASVTFANGNVTTSDANGKARASVVANGSSGGFVVSATSPGASNTAQFELTNVAANVPPTISWFAPVGNTVIDAPGTLSLSANASDADGSISKVEFFNGTTLVGTGLAANGKYTYNWTNIPAGTYSLTAKATDNQGAIATTPAISLTVRACGSVNAVTFTNQDGVSSSTLITSNAVVVSGINCPAPISVTNGEYSINGGAFTNAAASVIAGDQIRLRVLSSPSSGQSSTVVVNLGGVITGFTVTTATTSGPTFTQSFLREGRVLVLVSCSESEDQGAGSCGPARKQVIDQYLTSLGVDFVSTTDVIEFQRQLRCGRYNVFWISGGFAKLNHSLDDELAEAIFRGDGLIVDGVHDSRNSRLDEVTQIKYKGKLSGDGHVVFNETGVLPAGHFTSAGKAAKLTLEGASKLASFDQLGTGDAAVVTSNYGRGKSITFGFDWVATAMAQPNATLIKETMTQGLSHVTPLADGAGTEPTPGAYLRLRTAVTNPSSSAMTIEVKATLPATASLGTSSPVPTTVVDRVVTWRIVVNANSTANIDWSLRAPSTDSSAGVPSTLAVVNASTTTPIDSTTTPLVIRSYAIRHVTVRAQLAALNPTANAEKQARDRAVADLDRANSKRTAGAYQLAIEALIDAANELDKIATVATQSTQLAIDELLKIVGRDACAAGTVPTACSATGSFTSPAEFGGDGNDNGNVRYVRVRGGGAGSPNTGFGSGQWQVGMLLKQGGNQSQSLSNFGFVTGKSYNWKFEYKGNGNSAFSLIEPNRQSVMIANGSGWKVDGALRFLVHADAGLGNNTRVESVIQTLNGTSLNNQLIATSGNNQAADVVKVLSGPALLSPFTVTGTLSLFFTGSTPPNGNKLYFQINAGEGECLE